MHTLKIQKKENAEKIILDDFELKDVAEYEIKSSTNKQAELTVKMLVDVDEISIQRKSHPTPSYDPWEPATPTK